MTSLVEINGNIFVIISWVWLAGIGSFFSPCIFPVLPIYMGILTGNPGKKSLRIFSTDIYIAPIIKTVFFVTGLATVFILLGFGAGTLGLIINNDYLPVIMGAIVIILGLHQMEIINFSFMQKQKTISLKRQQYDGYWGSYILGLTFSFGWTPCIGPVLSTILAISLSGSKVFLGGALMGVYTLGMAIPFLIISVLSTTLLKKISFIKPYMNLIKKIGGLLIVLVGVLLLFNQVNFLTSIL